MPAGMAVAGARERHWVERIYKKRAVFCFVIGFQSAHRESYSFGASANPS